jgi:hypothetical protein
VCSYFGVLASHSSKRREVVPEPPDDPSAHAPPSKSEHVEAQIAGTVNTFSTAQRVIHLAGV